MDNRRLILYAALAIIVYSLWVDWQVDYPKAKSQETIAIATQPSTELPPPVTLKTQSVTNNITQENNPIQASTTIHVKTDVLDVYIDLKQGDIIKAALLDYPESLNEKHHPFTLLQNSVHQRYVANSTLYVVTNNTLQNADATYSTESKQYKLLPNQNELLVTLKGVNKDGIAIEKQFLFKKSSYLIDINYKLHNQSTNSLELAMNSELLRRSPEEDKSSMFHVGSYTGASYSNPGHHKYQKVNFNEMLKNNLSVDMQGGWFAMQQHYFLSAWVPTLNDKLRLYTRVVNSDYMIGAVSDPIIIKPEENKTLAAKLYIGPEITNVLKDIAPGLDLTVDYGWLWFLSSLLFSVMKFINNFIGNWGWTIVLVTVLIKLIFYRLSATSYKSMAAMRRLQPKLLELRERYGADKVKISQSTMELYRKEKVNPLGGCLPILIQIPVFIALYWVLLESVELRQAPFILWIQDLAIADPYHILPIIMGGTMVIQQKLNPAPPDPVQAKVMMFLPILFTALFWNFPAGLVLYWIVNNSLSILQQWYITKKYSEDPPRHKLVAANK